MDKELVDLKIEIAAFTAQVKEWMDTTKDYRVGLCGKIDRINDKMERLPCVERRWIGKSIYVLYSIDILLITAIVYAFVAHLAK